MMEPMDIGLAVSIGLVVLVVLGMRVAFAAALAGFIGLLWIFWAKKDYAGDAFLWALTVATKTAGQVPHSKVSSQALSLIPVFILIGYLAYYAGLTQALFAAAKRWLGWVPGGLAVSTGIRRSRVCCGLRSFRGNRGGVCAGRDPRNDGRPLSQDVRCRRCGCGAGPWRR